jgi:hypothetical protein
MGLGLRVGGPPKLNATVDRQKRAGLTTGVIPGSVSIGTADPTQRHPKAEIEPPKRYVPACRRTRNKTWKAVELKKLKDEYKSIKVMNN